MRLDHVVWIVHDLEEAGEAARSLGFDVVPGGRHAGLGSRNALVALADGSYLELASFADPPDPPLPAVDRGTSRREAREALEAAGARRFEARWLSQAGLEPGLSDVAFAWSDDVRGAGATNSSAGSRGARDDEAPTDRAVAALRARGLDLSEPLAMSRTRPDGFELAWRMIHPDGCDLPFLIDDLTPRDERVPSTAAHPNGATGIASVAVAVGDLGRSVARWRRLLGRDGTEAEDGDGRPGHAFDVGRSRVILVSASHHADLAARIEMRGEGVYGLRLRRAKAGSADGGVLRTTGALGDVLLGWDDAS